MLIGARALLGLAGAALMPSTLALVTVLFDDRRRATAISVWATCLFAGAALGPVVGGAMLEHWWWGSVFPLALPVVAVLLVAGPLVLPEIRGNGAGPIDPAGVVLLLATVLPVVHAIKSASLVALLAGVAAGLLFVRRQSRLDDPLLDVRLFCTGRLSLALGAMIGAGIAMAGLGLAVSQHLQVVLGLSPLAAAVWFAPMGLGVAAGTLGAPAMLALVPDRAVASGGLGLAGLGALLLALAPVGDGPVLLTLGVTVIGMGAGPLFALGTGWVIAAAPAARAGSAAALAETGNYLGAALGTAVLGSVAAAAYRSALGDAAPGDTVSGTVAAAADLPPGPAEALVAAAHAASVSGLHTVAWCAVGLFAMLALATARIGTR